MNSILKYIPLSIILAFVSAALVGEGNRLKNMDADNVGREDAAGNICLAIAPVLLTISDPTGNETAFKKAITIVRDAINNYLSTTT